MDPVTLTFLIIGAVGAAILFLALVVGDILHFASPDIDGPFSLPAIAAFIGGMGFVGAIPAALIPEAAGSPLRATISALVGLAGAVPLALLAAKLTSGLSNMKTDPTLTEADLSGALGVVITPIPDSGYGEVRVRVHGTDRKYAARAASPLGTGTNIFVVNALSASSVEVVSTDDA